MGLDTGVAPQLMETTSFSKNDQRWDLFLRPIEINEYSKLELPWARPSTDSSNSVTAGPEQKTFLCFFDGDVKL